MNISCYVGPQIREPLPPGRGDTLRPNRHVHNSREPTHQRRRHSNDSVRAPEGKGLHRLIKAITNSTSGEPMDGTHSGNQIRSRRHTTNHIRPVTMRVDDSWSHTRDDVAQQAVFSPVAARRNYYGREGNLESVHSSDEWMLGGFARPEDRGDMHSFLSLPRRQHRDDAFESTFPHWSEHVEHADRVIHSRGTWSMLRCQ